MYFSMTSYKGYYNRYVSDYSSQYLAFSFLVHFNYHYFLQPFNLFCIFYRGVVITLLLGVQYVNGLK
jgi:hypothetical protein